MTKMNLLLYVTISNISILSYIKYTNTLTPKREIHFSISDTGISYNVETIKKVIKAKATIPVKILPIPTPITAQDDLPSNYKDYIYAYESNFNTKVFSPSRKHSGICQMGDAALNEVGYAKSHYMFALENYKVQDKYCTLFFKNSIKTLKENNMTVSLTNIYVLHQQGKAGGLTILNNPQKAWKMYRNSIVNNINAKELQKIYLKYTTKMLYKCYNEQQIQSVAQ